VRLLLPEAFRIDREKFETKMFSNVAQLLLLVLAEYKTAIVFYNSPHREWLLAMLHRLWQISGLNGVRVSISTPRPELIHSYCAEIELSRHEQLLRSRWRSTRKTDFVD